MVRTEISIIIDRPVEEVFTYSTEIERLHEWNDVIQDSWPISGDPAEVGSTYLVRAKVMGKTMEIPSEVVAYDPNRKYAYHSKGGMDYVSTKIYEETKNGTKVTERLDMEREGRFSRLLDPLMLSISKRSHQKNLKLLKDVLEGPGEVGLA